MRERTYAVYWSEDGGPRYVGKMTFGPSFLELSGSAAVRRRSLHRILFAELTDIHYRSGLLQLRPEGGAAVEIGSVDRPGALTEVAERLRGALVGITGGGELNGLLKVQEQTA